MIKKTNFTQACVDQSISTLWWFFTIVTIDFLFAPFNRGVIYVRFITSSFWYILLVVSVSVCGGALLRYYFPHVFTLDRK